jgi:hypothetical protein
MVYRRNIQSKHHLSSKKISRRSSGGTQQTSSSIASMVKQTPSENLDDETKLAKRHLTKEMWQLVSIAVKRMADELVSISNNQQAAARTVNQEPQTASTETTKVPIQPSLSAKLQQPLITNAGAGDVPFVKEKLTISKEPIPRRTLPIQLLESTLHPKKKGVSNNARRRTIKSKIQNKSPKKNGKATTQRLRNNYKLK